VLVPLGTRTGDGTIRYSVVKETVIDGDGYRIEVKSRQKGGDETAVRERILEAAFAAFMKSGYATTSMLEMRRARAFEARALRASWQQTGNADRLHQRARQRLDVPAALPVLRRSRDPRAGAGFFRDKARPRDKRSHGHCGIPTGDR